MKITIISEGREKADPATPMVADYLSRISKFNSVDDIVLRPGAKNGLIDRVQKEQKKTPNMVLQTVFGVARSPFQVSALLLKTSH